MKFPLALAATAARLLPAPLKKAIYHSGPLARLLRGVLNRAAPGGLSVVQVAAGGLQGAWVLLDMQMEKDYWLGTYEPELQQAVRDWVRPGQVIYDVGANVGYVALLLGRAAGPGGQVFAFEPLPANLDRIRRNLELNHKDAAFAPITVVAGAVVNQPGPVRFLTHASGAMGKAAGSAGRTEEHYQAEIEAPGITLDDFVFGQGQPCPQVIKMDIEGGEVLALQGMLRLLARGPDGAPPLLLLELHGPESARCAWETLTAAGYTLRRMQPGYPPIPALDALDWKAYLVATPEEG